MSFRFPVTTQEPVSVRPIGTVRRTVRHVLTNVGGDLNLPIVVPTGKIWRVEGIVAQVTCSVAVPATIRLDVIYHTSAPDGSGNLISSIVCPFGAELTHLFSMGIGYPYGQHTFNRAGAADSRFVMLPLPDTLLFGSYEIDFDLYDFGANDDFTVYVTYSEVEE